MSAVPELRFPEFTGSLPKDRVGHLATVKTGSRDTQNRVSDGPYPFFVRSDNIERIDSFALDKEAVLTSGDGVGVGKNFHYIDGKFDYHQRVYAIYDFSCQLSGSYFYHYFSSRFYQHVMRQSAKNSVDSVRMSMITDMHVPVPTLPEQQKIAAFLGAVDGKIDALRRKYDALKQFKAGLMQKLFSQELRFKRDDGSDYPDWEERRLSRLAIRPKLKNSELALTRVLTNSAVRGVIDQSDYFDKDIANAENLSGYYVVELGDFVYNPRISASAPVGPLNRNDLGRGVMSPLYTVFRFNAEETEFYQQYFRSNFWHPYMKSVANYGARHDRMAINTADFMAMPVPVLHSDEQRKVTSFLSAVDAKVEAVEGQITHMEAFKAGLLQKMFV